MNFFNELLISIFVAIITAIAIYVFRKFIHPLILSRLQNTPNLAGNWLGYDIQPGGVELQDSRMTIRQIGTNISATVYRQSNNRERIFKYTGIISSGQVLLIWKETQGNGYNMGTMTLILSGDLQNLSGKTTYHAHDIAQIVSSDKIYRRIRN